MFGSYKKAIEVIEKLQKEKPYAILTDKMIIKALEEAWENEEHAYAEHMAGRLEGGINGR